jgi:hypothetical protein
MNTTQRSKKMETDEQARMERAVKKLDAVEVYGSLDNRVSMAMSRLGADRVYAYYDDAMGRYYIVDAVDVDGLVDYMDSDDDEIARDAYSHWCAGTSAVKMPEGWTP